MRIQPFQSVLLAVFSLGIATSVQASPSDYTFTNLIDSTSGYSNFTTPIINNKGQVAFVAGGASNPHGSLLRVSPGGQLTTIARSSNDETGFLLGGINDSGVVAFLAGMDQGVTGIYTSDGSHVTTIAENRGLVGPPSGWYFGIAGLGQSAISNDGTVVFTAGSNSEGLGLFAYKNGNITTLARGTDFGDLLGEIPTFALSDNGQVVFSGTRHSDNVSGLFKVSPSGGAPLVYVNQQDLGTDITHSPFSLNKSGRVAFEIQSSDSTEIATSEGGAITTIIHGSATSGMFESVGNPSINNSNEVAFLGSSLQSGKHVAGIFTGPNPETDAVIAVNNQLFGSTLFPRLAFDPNGLNDIGQIAFEYELANGVTGIGIVTPVGIPEPFSVTLLVTISSLANLRHWRQTPKKRMCLT